MAVLPNSEQAILDIRKIEEYCLNSGAPARPPQGSTISRIDRTQSGRQCVAASDIAGRCQDSRGRSTRRGSVWQSMAGRRSGIATRQKRCDKNRMDRADRRGIAAVRYLLGHVMTDQSARRGSAAVLDVVALLADAPVEGLARGQVGTVVESLDERTALVEFADDQGRAYAIVPCARSDLLVLHYVPQEA
jgi:hypothetical protein